MHWLLEYSPAISIAVHIGIIVIAALVLARVVAVATSQLPRVAAAGDVQTRTAREQRATTVAAILNSVARVAIISAALLMVLGEINVNITPLIAGAGILGVAVGFGAQSLVKDFFAGFFIVFENQFDIGDQVTIAGHTGTVERMTLRVTVLRDLDGNVHIVPNGKVETVTVIAKEWARVNVDVTVPYREDLARAIEVAARVTHEFAEEHADALVDDPEILGVQELGPRGVTLRVAVKTPPGRNLAVGRELRRRLKLAYDHAGLRFAERLDDAPPRPDSE